MAPKEKLLLQDHYTGKRGNKGQTEYNTWLRARPSIKVCLCGVQPYLRPTTEQWCQLLFLMNVFDVGWFHKTQAELETLRVQIVSELCFSILKDAMKVRLIIV